MTRIDSPVTPCGWYTWSRRGDAARDGMGLMGPTLRPHLDELACPKDIKITDQQMEGRQQHTLRRHDLHGE